ncbi:PLP-dependent aminotransferase family protein [Bradyrhizobium prioriisuperbiae]|uniref:aminotransferase-like domain-containing protein n=1 Tax=Bradyrhizobium prioriisuperbiae TaxID=2854389 RepID=UPI0028EAAC16|nr:PLP-dependent aminotransferase family protein [Bradyrhizobium prioritasuperba]
MTSTIWKPILKRGDQVLYRALAQSLTDDIRSGKLPPGTQLPPVRKLASRLKVTVGTVRRAFELAMAAGLIDAHVGRGTFVTHLADMRTNDIKNGSRLELIDMAINKPAPIEAGDLLARATTRIVRSDNGWALMDYRDQSGFSQHRRTIAHWLRTTGVPVHAEQMVLTVGASQGLAVALATTTRPGDKVFVEELTYPGVKNLIRIFGLEPVPVAIDREGLVTSHLAALINQQNDVRVLICMPRVHNPTTRSMSSARKQDLAELANLHDLTLIEDDCYGPSPSRPSTTLFELCPERTFYVSSLSKSVAPGLRVGYVVASERVFSAMSAISQSMSWTLPPLMVELAADWIRDGSADKLAQLRHEETVARQKIVSNVLGNHPYEASQWNTHVWLHLPEAWNPARFVESAKNRGLLVVSGDLFSIQPRTNISAVRLGIGSPATRELVRNGLTIVANLLHASYDFADVT